MPNIRHQTARHALLLAFASAFVLPPAAASLVACASSDSSPATPSGGDDAAGAVQPMEAGGPVPDGPDGVAPLQDAGPPPDPARFGFTAPSPEPALPDGTDPYSPPLPVTTVSAAIAEAIHTGIPGDTILTTGDGFVPGTTRFKVFGQNGAASASVEIDGLRMTTQTAGVPLPGQLPANAMYLVYPGTRGAYGMPVAVNRTDAHWVGPSVVAAGASAGVYGENLSHDHGTTAGHVYIKAKGPVAGSYAHVTYVDPFHLQFDVPANTAPGDYEVWAHNGHGGHLGWSGPLALTVIATSPFFAMDAKVVNVKDHGAKGDGQTDDTAALNAAITAMRAQAPATLYFPAGTYVVSHGLSLGAGEKWRGEGRDTTIIKAGSSYPNDWFVYPAGNCGDAAYAAMLEGLTLDADGHALSDTRMMEFRGCHDMRFKDVRLKMQQNCLDFANSTRLYFDDVDFVGSGFFFGNARQVFMDACTFHMMFNANSMYIWGGTDYAITNTQAMDQDPQNSNGFGIGRFVVTNPAWGSVHNFYIANNETIAFAPQPTGVDQNQGEQILFEMGKIVHYAPPSAMTATTITLPDVDFTQNDYTSWDVYVTQGKGLGQYRRIVAQDATAKTITVSPAFRVMPDATSRIEIGGGASGMAIYRNRFEGKSDYATRYTASTGIQTWGYGYDVIGEENTFHNTRGVVSLWAVGTQDPNVPVTPSSFNLFQNNTANDCLGGMAIQVGSNVSGPNQVLGNIGNVFRRNTFDGIDGTVFQVLGLGNATLNAFENSTATRAHGGVSTATGANAGTYSDNLLFGNSFSLDSAPFAGSVGFYSGPNATWYGVGNTFKGYESGNTGP